MRRVRHLDRLQHSTAEMVVASVILHLMVISFVHECLSQDAVQDNFLLVAGRPYLYQLDLRSGALISLLDEPRYGLTAVAYDPVEMVIYWTDVNQGLIGKVGLFGSRQYSTIIFRNPMGALPLDGLALDSEYRKLYYADAGNTSEIVEINLDGSRPVSLVNETGMLPRALVLDTKKRDLYYTDWGVQPGIYVIDLSTHKKTTILTDGLVWPNALAIDFEERVLYWADAKLHRIEMANLDGSGREMLATETNAQYYAMALSSQYLYITDWNYNAVKRLDRKAYYMSDQRPQVFGTLFGIVYYNSSFSSGDNTKTNGGGTTTEPDKNIPTTQIDTTIAIVVAVVVGSVILTTGMITLGVCLAVQRRRTRAAKEPHYMTSISSDDSSAHTYEAMVQYI